MTFSNDTYEVSLNPANEDGVVGVSITYFNTSERLKAKKKSFIIDFNNDFIVQGNICNFIIDYYTPSRKKKEEKNE